MIARVVTATGAPDKVDEAIRYFRDVTIPMGKGMPGARGAYFLVDRRSGKTMVISLWEDEAALNKYAAEAGRLREERLKKMAPVAAPNIEIYEVALQTEIA